MLRGKPVLFAFLMTCVIGLPGTVSAQSTTSGAIAGSVKDSTGAVLPGVTVEAASPALIEKMVTAVSDDAGNYKIINLRPGTYTVTFTLPGFSTVKREGVEVSLGTTSNVSGDLKVGSLEETVTVTGSSPIVDVQNVRQQQVLTQTQLQTIPTPRTYLGMTALTLGASGGGSYTGTAGNRDVGGSNGDGVSSMSIHGSRTDGAYNIEGMRTNSMTGNGQSRRFRDNPDAMQESVAETGGQTAEMEAGGVSVNVIVREGGNSFHGLAEGEYAGTKLADWMQSSNISDELRARGVPASSRGNRAQNIYAFGGGVGGPIRQDKVWFYTAARTWATKEDQAGIFFNQPNLVHTLFYAQDTSRPAFTDTWVKDSTSRMTFQVSSKHKVSAYAQVQKLCACRNTLAATRAPESTTFPVIGPGVLAQVNWSHPRTNRLLFEAGFATRLGEVHNIDPLEVTKDDIGVTNTNLAGVGTISYGPNVTTPGAGGPYGDLGFSTQYNTMLSVSYVTGSHAFKFGEQSISGANGVKGRLLNENYPFLYNFNNNVPTSITGFLSPANYYTNVKYNLGVFAQDQWTLNRLTLNLGARLDMLNAYSPASTRPASFYFPETSFPAANNLPNWKDISPRLGAAYDVFGNGRTAIKASLGRYVVTESVTPASNQNPQAALSASASRSWTDRDGDYVPDCDLRSLTANGECGAYTNSNFGKSVISTRYDPEFVEGFMVRPYNWQAQATVAQDLGHGIAVIGGYFRTWYGNNTVTDNLALDPANYSRFCIRTPSDARLGEFAAQEVCGYDLNAAVTATDNFIRVEDARTEVFNGVDLAVRARFGNGGLLNGGVSLGNTHIDSCQVVDSPAQALQPFCETDNNQNQVKINGSYPLFWGISAAAVYQNIPGTNQTATLTLTSAQLRTVSTASDPNLISTTVALPRNLTTASGTTSMAIIPTNAMREKRGQQLDLRFSKVFKFSSKTLRAGFDIYNATNSNDVISVTTAYTPSATTPGGSWLRPGTVLPGRLYKFGATFNF
jgi:hypothetical protein